MCWPSFCLGVCVGSWLALTFAQWKLRQLKKAIEALDRKDE